MKLSSWKSLQHWGWVEKKRWLYKKKRVLHFVNAKATKVWFLIARLTVIAIAPLKEIFCNSPLLKDISFNTKCLLIWWLSSNMVGSGDFGDKLPSWFFEKFAIALVLLRQFGNFQKCTRTIYPKSSLQTCDYQYYIVCTPLFFC